MSSLLGPRRARTLYNLADAILADETALAEDGSRRDLLPGVERQLRHEGLGAIRRTWIWLAALDLWPLLAGPRHRLFWRLTREERRRSFEGLCALPIAGSHVRRLERRLEQAAAAASGTSGDHSTDGA